MNSPLFETRCCSKGACEKGWTGCSLDKLRNYSLQERYWGFDWAPFAFVMAGHTRLRSARYMLESVIDRKVPGDFAELGAWRGGVSIFAKLVLNACTRAGAQTLD